MLLCQYLFSWVCHPMAKRPDWAMKSWTAWNINEFMLFDMSGVKQVVFLTVNHRGPLPLRELHSTGETECGETLGDLEPVYDLFTITSEITARGCDTDKWHLCKAGLFFLRWITADTSPWGNFTPPTKQQCGETLGDLEPVYDLFTIASETTLPEAVSQTSGTFVKQISFFFFLFFF